MEPDFDRDERADFHVRRVIRGKAADYVRFVHLIEGGPVERIEWTWEAGHAFRFPSKRAAWHVQAWVRNHEGQDTETIVEKAEPFDLGGGAGEPST